MKPTPRAPTAAREPPFPGFLLVPIALAVGAGVMAARPATERPVSVGARAIPTDPGNPLVAYGCTGCHALEPGQEAPSGPLLTGAAERGPNLAGAAGRGAQRIADPAYTGTARDSDAWLAESIMDHCADVAPGWSCEGVDAYGNWLSPEEVGRLVDLVAKLPTEEP